MTSGSRRPPPDDPWWTTGRARRWGLVGLLLGLLSGCTSAAPPPPPPPVGSVVGTVTECVRWHRPELGAMLISSHDGPGSVRLRPTTPIRLHTIGQLQPLAPAAIQVGDHVTIRLDGVILTSSPSQLTAVEIVVVR